MQEKEEKEMVTKNFMIPSDSIAEITKNRYVMQSLKEVEEIRAGKKPKRSAWDLLDELEESEFED